MARTRKDFFDLTNAHSCEFSANESFGVTDPQQANSVITMVRLDNPGSALEEDVDAVVKPKIDVVCSPVDHNEEFMNRYGDRKKCDGFIYSKQKDVFIFLEIKNWQCRTVLSSDITDPNAKSQFSEEDIIHPQCDWRDEAVAQLQSAISIFKELNADVHKKSPLKLEAYVVNPNCLSGSEVVDLEQKDKFLEETGYSLYIDNTIEVLPPYKPISLRISRFNNSALLES